VSPLACDIKGFFETVSVDLEYKEAQEFWDLSHKIFYCILVSLPHWIFYD